MKKRLYTYKDMEVTLDPVSESAVRVTYRERTGYIGLKRDWEADRPYTWISWEGDIHEDGIAAAFSYTYPVLELALEDLCSRLVREQRKQDSQRVNPEERKKAARKMVREFLEELPDAPVEAETPGFPKGRETESGAVSHPGNGRSDSLRQLIERTRQMAARA